MDKQMQDELKKIGMDIVPQSPFMLDPRKGLIGIRVDIAIDAQTNVKAPDFNVLVVNKRGVLTTFSDWSIVDTPQGRKLTFIGYQQLPDGCRPPFSVSFLATTFVDLCYFQGNEAVDPDYVPPVSTPIPPGAEKKDLGWYLPSRFVDSMIDALGKVNEVFLSGLLEEAVLTGILIQSADLTPAVTAK